MARPEARLAGAWRLVRWRVEKPDGTTEDPYAGDSYGLVIFTPDGWMSAQIALRPADGGASTPAAYIAYCGAYQVDEASETLTTTVEASASPAMLRTRQVRRFLLEGDDLTLWPPPQPSGQRVITWRRLGRPPA